MKQVDRLFRRLSTVALLIAIPAGMAAAQSCEQPQPPEVPQTAPGEMEEVLAVQEEVKAYIDEANDYLACSDAGMKELAARQASIQDEALADGMEAQIQEMLAEYNATVDEMHLVGERYNQLVAQVKGPDS